MKGTTRVASKASRLFALDAQRGLILVLMALDHASHFVAQKHSPGEYWGGPFPAYDSALAFLTRLVTHLCAPGFFFLMGAGIVLFASARRREGWGTPAVMGHLFLRGGLLVALQFLVVNRAWELSPGGWVVETYVGALFALGGAMIVCSFLLWARPPLLLVMGVVLLVGTQLLTPSPALWTHDFSVPARLLLVPGGDLILWVNYPLLPWLGLAILGMGFGHWLVEDPDRAFRRGFKVGLALLLAFVLLRFVDGFGNIRPREGDSWIDLLNVVKYPPSLAFTLLTLGLNLVLMGLWNRLALGLRRFFQPLLVYGRVPLFFYIVHLFLYAALGHLLAPGGTTLPLMVLYWLLGLLLLYPLCLGYGWLKDLPSLRPFLRFF